jgi:hypothetical protein
MAETDILNPVRTWWSQINDNPNPSYGYTRRSANNSALARARLGAPYSRETMNQGFAFEFNYVDRPWSTILRLKHFYESFKGGYFTYIDWDGGGRHHVGRFTSPVNPMETANNKYTVQALVFEEMPQSRMVQYPADFANWSRTINVLDDFLNPTVATYSSSAGAWISQLNPALSSPSATDPTAYEIYNATPTIGDYAQVQYVGWGFQMNFRRDNSLGQVAILVDGAACCVIDLSTGAAVGSLPTGVTVSNGLLTSIEMPLDMHRVKVQAYAAGANGGSGAIYPAITVIV